jgi:hypothetical protein
MKYVILGSGPSIEKYEPAGADVVISCHFAISEDTTHLCSNHLREYGWQPIPTISAVKHRMVKYNSLKSYPKHLLWQPATEEANWETPSTVCVEGLCVYVPEAFYRQKIDTGVTAVIWCLAQTEVETIDLWGFDELRGNRDSIMGPSGTFTYPTSRKDRQWIVNHPKIKINQ